MDVVIFLGITIWYLLGIAVLMHIDRGLDWIKKEMSDLEPVFAAMAVMVFVVVVTTLWPVFLIEHLVKGKEGK